MWNECKQSCTLRAASKHTNVPLGTMAEQELDEFGLPTANAAKAALEELQPEAKKLCRPPPSSSWSSSQLTCGVSGPSRSSASRREETTYSGEALCRRNRRRLQAFAHASREGARADHEHDTPIKSFTPPPKKRCTFYKTQNQNMGLV